MLSLLWFLLIGLVAGALARLLVPGRDPLGCLGTLLLGVTGSLVGGTLLNLVQRGDLSVATSGLLGSVVGAVLALLLWRAAAR